MSIGWWPVYSIYTLVRCPGRLRNLFVIQSLSPTYPLDRHPGRSLRHFDLELTNRDDTSSVDACSS
jgi:hypothetical protein